MIYFSPAGGSLSLPGAQVASTSDRRKYEIGVRHTLLVTITDAMKASLILKLGSWSPNVAVDGTQLGLLEEALFCGTFRVHTK